jgi:hypothetical protein
MFYQDLEQELELPYCDKCLLVLLHYQGYKEEIS